MRKILLFLLVIMSIGSFLVFAQKGQNNVRNMLIGKWKYVGKVEDMNGNRVIDAKDKYHDRTSTQLVINYKQDGTVTFFYGGVDNNNNWELLYNDTYLKISDPEQTGHNYTLQHIDSLTATRFVGRDTMYGRVEWNIYERQ